MVICGGEEGKCPGQLIGHTTLNRLQFYTASFFSPAKKLKDILSADVTK